VKTEFRRKVSDTWRTGTLFPIGIGAIHVRLKLIVDVAHTAQVIFVRRDFLEPALLGKLQHADGIVIGLIP